MRGKMLGKTTKVRSQVVYSGTGKRSHLGASSLVGNHPWSAVSNSLDVSQTRGACLPND